MQTIDTCPCGSGILYTQCCQPYHSGQALPATAETLMRSRFSAYALGNMAYIQNTWDSRTRPKEEKLNFGGEEIFWHKLEIISRKKGGANDDTGVVEFKAYYHKDGEDHILHETSRFVNNNGRWLYVDGIVRSVGKPIQQFNQGKNAPCPCGSGKKFKRCCGKDI